MAILVYDCPRCASRHMTFDVSSDCLLGEEHGWQRIYEAFGVCRGCHKASVFLLKQGDVYSPSDMRYRRRPCDFSDSSLNNSFRIEGFISLKDKATAAAPDHSPSDVAAAFREGATCFTVKCFNAAGTMFRLAVDLATRPMLPAVGDPARPDARTCRDLGLRLPWLFANGKLPPELKALASCIREDGNDGAHQGTLGEDEATDLQEFAGKLLERVFTLPKQLELAEQRRQQRRAKTL